MAGSKKLIESSEKETFRFAKQGWEVAQQRKKTGRKLTFDDPIEFERLCLEYFTFCDENPLITIDYKGKDATPVTMYRPRAYTFTGLCSFLAVSSKYMFYLEGLMRSKIDKINNKNVVDIDIDISNIKLSDADKKKKIGIEKEDELELNKAREYLDIIARIRDTMYTQKFEYAAAGMLEPNLIARDLGMIEKTAKGIEEKDTDSSKNVKQKIVLLDDDGTRMEIE